VAGITVDFTKFGRDKFLTLPLPVFYLAAVAFVLWYLLGHTPFGRYLYAIGANPNAARLAGLKVGRMKLIAFMISGMLASFAGIVLTMQLGAAVVRRGRLLSPTCVRRGLPRCDPDPARTVQHRRDGRRALPARHRRAGAPAQVPGAAWIKKRLPGFGPDRGRRTRVVGRAPAGREGNDH